MVVGLGSCGIAAGGHKVKAALMENLKKAGLKVQVSDTGCVGMCYSEVLLDVHHKNGQVYTYGNMTPDRMPRFVDQHLTQGQPVAEWLVRASDRALPDDSFYAKQKRIVLRNCGQMDPEKIEDYMAHGGYQALEKALRKMSPDQVIKEVLDSGLRGRGGAGFPTGRKWQFARGSQGGKKYIVCNGDEGDPGAFMDRSVLEGDPHNVMEGMLIAGYAIGADEGYFYVRAEYPLAVERLKLAIGQAKKKGFLGQNIMGTKFCFEMKIKEGAGAFVCGEETALMASIEGQRGMPRLRPPFPAVSGLWGKPTNINNVETFANVPWIILNGAAAFASLGTEKSKGSKVFALAGKIARGGLVEVPMGITINEIIHEVGGGIKDGRSFKAVQMGGPSGGCIPAALGNTIVDYDSVGQTGAIMGSGGMVVMDDTTCMVDIARFFLDFTQKESCGKCTFCRVGTKRMLETLERITKGQGKEGDIELLLELAEKIKISSLCGLGQTAPNPVLTTVKYFRDEYEAHIKEKRCPAHSCKELLKYEVVPEKCVGCTACARVCPVTAISGQVKKPHVIDQEACIKCGNCVTKCKFDAIKVR
ncbi:MAG: NADH dehydrogenase [Candidatus Edwardsbacteria bacterium RIFOXYD12_FULL_50_11]|uniref:NADH dehydrogenase n=1 Tax=Candidatus Edwardsbacteria bacterium GWF2_54_11 TaxID=1817851 RepID=A0A1F5RH05_9BACT|nr:MAG: NADH dehydrogenase [Candidatus Edwardsbacteria bacterium RifOxyC12_full_54_24]OGF07995.1 MAG: NADH dehydrogenase [Candidatus Edwardsbacteria bacterium RifOxyA12_full_54_48]OGF10243.1 MAG: NADH dehydrogenase [Candidatus Edwardsbacteria bacterium GWE2_54_12]OGF13817.1 MAG: NADH dehydrogenase [Candidatus Edwardsbacteria bacterium GWF2_54_11]OGF17277.1 MAG: NADH dehydrogenase [Candidatus Edwardsbacteria bacterium RIFOXYD12_FULL_50_11]OGJ18422.1 MAG: NADH dehydrogenase [Candidatus Edwardsba